ncbi:unnamed protein product, partial [Chrysoparadoxa australica]
MTSPTLLGEVSDINKHFSAQAGTHVGLDMAKSKPLLKQHTWAPKSFQAKLQDERQESVAAGGDSAGADASLSPNRRASLLRAQSFAGSTMTIRDLMTRDLVIEAESPADEALHAVAATTMTNKELERGKKKREKEGGEEKRHHRRVDSRVEKMQRAALAVRRRGLGTEVTETHKMYALTYMVILGLRCTTGRRSLVAMDKDLDTLTSEMDNDKLTFPPEGTGVEDEDPRTSSKGCSVNKLYTPPHQLNHEFKFKDYCPKMFHSLRRIFGVDEADYLHSLCGDFNFIEFLSNSKSGSFFFYSFDGKYMIKTISKAESHFLRHILPPYRDYVNTHSNSLLNRFLGLHRIKAHWLGNKVHFVVIGSVFDTPKPIHRKFDLKGSTVGREVSAGKRDDPNLVLKDNDMERLGMKIHAGPQRDALLETLRLDADFLAGLNIIDYSLLVGVHDSHSMNMGQKHRSVKLTGAFLNGVGEGREITATESEDDDDVDIFLPTSGQPARVWSHEEGGFRGRRADGTATGDLYFVAIIDMLQTYDYKKRIENGLKGLMGKNRKWISV